MESAQLVRNQRPAAQPAQDDREKVGPARSWPSAHLSLKPKMPAALASHELRRELVERLHGVSFAPQR